MKNKKKILAILPCRAGSKRLKNKNILEMHGIPLYEYTLQEVCKSKLITNVIISTDIKEILDKYDCAERRPKKLCADKSPLDDALRYVILEEKKKGNEYDLILMTHCNIPIRKEGEIDKLIKIALKNPKATAVCSGVEVTEPPEWMFHQYYLGEQHVDLKGKITKDKCTKYFERTYQAEQCKTFRKQDIPKRWNIDGAIEIIRTDVLMKADGQKAFDYFGDKIIICPHEAIYGIEIDCQADYDYVEYLMHKDSF